MEAKVTPRFLACAGGVWRIRLAISGIESQRNQTYCQCRQKGRVHQVSSVTRVTRVTLQNKKNMYFYVFYVYLFHTRVTLDSIKSHFKLLAGAETESMAADSGQPYPNPWAGHCKGGKKIALRGGGGDTEAHFPNPPPSPLGRRDRRGGVQGGGARPAVPGGGVNPTSVAQNDTRVALIILTTQMWGGGGLLVENTFSGQILCSCAFGANIRSYTKQKARHGTPFLQPPPLSFDGRPCHPPPQGFF